MGSSWHLVALVKIVSAEAGEALGPGPPDEVSLRRRSVSLSSARLSLLQAPAGGVKEPASLSEQARPSPFAEGSCKP